MESQWEEAEDAEDSDDAEDDTPPRLLGILGIPRLCYHPAMLKHFLIAANWKMYKTIPEALEFVKSIIL